MSGESIKILTVLSGHILRHKKKGCPPAPLLRTLAAAYPRSYPRQYRESRELKCFFYIFFPSSLIIPFGGVPATGSFGAFPASVSRPRFLLCRHSNGTTQHKMAAAAQNNFARIHPALWLAAVFPDEYHPALFQPGCSNVTCLHDGLRRSLYFGVCGAMKIPR